MNYLAHLFLSGNEPEIVFGNLLEDFLNGRVDHPRNNHLSERIKDGIRLHRFIDTFTDTHELVREAKSVFIPGLGRYASVAIDVVFDHFLILNWNSFSTEDFELFRQRIYRVLPAFEPQMPEKLKAMVHSMILHDWLKDYAREEGLVRAFNSLNRQIKQGPDMTAAVPVMYSNHEFIQGHFLPFFNELKIECEKKLKNNG